MKARRKEYRVAPMIVYAVVAGFGLVLLYVGLTELVSQRRLLARAVCVPAEVLSSGVSESTSSNTDRRPLRSNSTTSYTAEVRFRYAVGGVTYESDTLRPTIIAQGHASRESAAEEVRGFPTGAKVDAWVDPATPDRAFLVREASVGPVVFAVLGLLLPLVGWLASRLV